MKLSVSNIAWPFEEQNKFFELIKSLGCSGVEIAPSIIWPNPVQSTAKARGAYKKLIHSFGLEIPAMHALLYGQKDLGLFRDAKTEWKTAIFLKEMCFLAADLGAKVLVFGSPNNRQRGTMSLDKAFERAAEFFIKIAPTAADANVKFCIEPLCPQETDFIMSVEEGLQLVKMVAHPAFNLHLDGKAVNAQGGEFSQLIEKAKPFLQHFHVNEPDLQEINTTGVVDHHSLGKALSRSDYHHYISIEMRKAPDYFNAVKRSILYVKKIYMEVG